jgi:hypothetical protein
MKIRNNVTILVQIPPAVPEQEDQAVLCPVLILAGARWQGGNISKLGGTNVSENNSSENNSNFLLFYLIFYI